MTKCTPQYNEETRRLMAHAADLRRVAKGAETGDFGPAIRAKANEVINAGESDPAKVVDAVHAFINEYAPHSPEEVRAGIVDVTPRTKSEAAARRAQVKAQLRDPNIAKNKTRQTVLRKELADLTRRIAQNDFAPKPARGKPVYDENTLALQRERNLLQRKFDNLLRRAEEKNKSLPWRAASLIHDFHLMAILSSLHVYPKLAAAVISRWVTTPAQAAVVSAAKAVIPGLRKIAEKAPVHGAGFDPRAEAEYFKGIAAAPKEALNQMRQGQSNAEATFAEPKYTAEYTDFMTTMADARDAFKAGDYREAAKVVTSFPGRTHAAVKEFASTPMFRKAYFLYDQAKRAELRKGGMSEAKIDAEMAKETTQAAIGAKAIGHAFEAKLQGTNRLADGINQMVSSWERGGVGEKALALAFKTIFPIRKIPLNIAKEITSYTAGGIKALVALRGDMTEARAEYIMKNIGQQGVGALLIALGVVLKNQLGGVPGTTDKSAKVKPLESDLGGINLGTGTFHGPAAQMLQIGASLARLYDKYQPEGGIDAALHALGETYGNVIVRNVPYLDQPRRYKNTIEYGRGRTQGLSAGIGEIVGQQARSILIPQAVQQVAAAQDPYKGYRKPRNIGEDIAVGIPGLREKVPQGKPVKP